MSVFVPLHPSLTIQVHQFDIVLDVLLVNQTTETLQNLTVEFATLGDLKVVERPATQNVAPHDFINLQATIKGRFYKSILFALILTYYSLVDRHGCYFRQRDLRRREGC